MSGINPIIIIYLKSISTPSSAFLPSTWAYDSIKSALNQETYASVFHTSLSWSCAIFLVLMNIQIANILYFTGFSKTQAALVKLFNYNSNALNRFFSFLSPPTKAFVIKELKTFWRDQTQWSQVFLVAALIIIYLYNFSVLPLEKAPIKTFYMQNLFSFLNMALAAFVLTAISARFAFPCVSMEGQSIWIMQSGPVSVKSFLWIKFFIYLFPLLILSEMLIIATNILLNVSPFMMWLSITTIFFLTPGIVSLGVGLGAAYPDFSSENPAQSVTSFGGLIFMIVSALCIGLVVILEAGPVYTIFMSAIKDHKISIFQWTWIVISFISALGISILSIILPISYGEKRLRRIIAE